MTSLGIEQRQAQLRREQEAFRGAEQPLREAIATMHAAIERWRADFTEANRQAAWAATGFVVEDEMAVLVAHARNAATTADGFLPDGVVKRIWRVMAELEHEHARRCSTSGSWSKRRCRTRQRRFCRYSQLRSIGSSPTGPSKRRGGHSRAQRRPGARHRVHRSTTEVGVRRR